MKGIEPSSSVRQTDILAIKPHVHEQSLLDKARSTKEAVALSSAGSSPASGTIVYNDILWPPSQKVKTLAFQARGVGFESHGGQLPFAPIGYKSTITESNRHLLVGSQVY